MLRGSLRQPTSPVINPATKILLFGWNCTSKGCSAHRAEQSSPPSIASVRRK